MASVLLSSFGQVAAGPVGAVLGSLAGAGADPLLRRRSRALPDLRVSSSAYGEPFPRVYGRARVSGVVIWASPLARGGGGKGGAGGTDGYVVSLAVALSSRPIAGVGRVWADGREIRNSSGQFATPVTFRVHRGEPGQKPDPLIMAFEGAASAPGYQGLAYAVLEDFPVSAYGNRIPALSFEVIADAEPRPAEWVRDLLSPLAVAGSGAGGDRLAEGYCASAEQRRLDAESLARFLGLELERPGTGWSIASLPRLWTIPRDDLLAGEEAGSRGSGSFRQTDYEGLPSRFEIGYLDLSRDFQRGLQAADAGRSGRSEVMALEVSATAAQARQLAERQLTRAMQSAHRLLLGLSWKWAVVAPGHLVQVEGRPETWRVEERTLGPAGVELGCVRADPAVPPHPVDAGMGSAGLGAAEAGRALLVAERQAPATEPILFEPVVPLRPGRGAELVVIATGASGWRGAEVRWNAPGALDREPLGRASAAIPFGTTRSGIGPGFPGVWDWRYPLRLHVCAHGERLQGRPAVAVLQGANLLLLGDELVQFQQAEIEADGGVVLSGLLRGCLGSEAAEHPEGERWALLEPGGELRIPLAADWVGGMVSVEAQGPGDWPAPAEAGCIIEGRAGSVLSPCHLRAGLGTSGELLIAWTPRLRDGFEWGPETGAGAVAHVVELRRAGDTAVFRRSVPAGVGQTIIEAGELRELFGGGPFRLSILVEADGAGPARFRRSRPIEFEFGN